MGHIHYNLLQIDSLQWFWTTISEIVYRKRSEKMTSITIHCVQLIIRVLTDSASQPAASLCNNNMYLHGLYSGYEDTPGHVLSVGVPKICKEDKIS